ncbi:MAG: ATP synthase subunit B family protein [Anaerolineae bacterium]
MLDHGWRAPFAGRVLVDEEMLLNIIDQMRICVPQEIRQAQELLAIRDQVLLQAQEEARHVLAQARQDAEQILEENGLRSTAEAQADAMLQEATEEAERIRAGADQYAERRLLDLQDTVTRLQHVLANGLETLQHRRSQNAVLEEPPEPESSAPGEQLDEADVRA